MRVQYCTIRPYEEVIDHEDLDSHIQAEYHNRLYGGYFMLVGVKDTLVYLTPTKHYWYWHEFQDSKLITVPRHWVRFQSSRTIFICGREIVNYRNEHSRELFD